MAKVINIIGSGSNVGKTYVMEGLIKELKSRGLSIATIKHDVHGFDIDKEGKDTYKHRKAGSETVIISSKNRIAIIKELNKETELQEIIEMASDKDIILVEGYKKSNLRKIEVYRGICSDILEVGYENRTHCFICKRSGNSPQFLCEVSGRKIKRRLP